MKALRRLLVLHTAGLVLILPSLAQNAGGLLGTGSGFVVTRNGDVLTNHHVVANCASLTVRLDGKNLTANLVRADQQNDLALLNVSQVPVAPLTFRESHRIRLGEGITVLGFPLQGIAASSLNLTTGTISALAGLRDDTRMFQFTAPVQPGNSGGPVLDDSGLVVGMVISKLAPLWLAKTLGDVPQNVNFAIRSSIIRAFLDSQGVEYISASATRELTSTVLAESLGKSIALIECNGAPRSADAPRGAPDRSPSPSLTLPLQIRIKHRHAWSGYRHAMLVLHADRIEFREIEDRSHDFSISVDNLLQFNQSYASIAGNPSYTIQFAQNTKAGRQLSFEIDSGSLLTLATYLKKYCPNILVH